MAKKCLNCEYSDIEPTGEGWCQYTGEDIHGNNNACSLYDKSTFNDDLEEMEFEDMGFA